MATGITDLEGKTEDISDPELPRLKKRWGNLRKIMEDEGLLANFHEQLNREWSIETGAIEDVYRIERGATETLIAHGFKVSHLTHNTTNKQPEYVIRVLRDQEEALDGVFDFVKGNRELSTSYIRELHAALLRSQETAEAVDPDGNRVDIHLIKGDWKKQPNYPTRDGITYTYCPPEHVDAEMGRLVDMHKAHVGEGVPTDVQAAWLHHRFTQIHPFQDGNGRVARALATLVFVKDGLFPLIITADIRASYIEALEKADDGELGSLVSLFAEVQKFRFEEAESRLEDSLKQGVGGELGRLLEIASEVAENHRQEEYEAVVNLAARVQRDTLARLKELGPAVRDALSRVSRTVSTGAYEGAGVGRKDVRREAERLGHQENFSAYESYVTMNVYWGDRRAYLSFAIYGLGGEFDGTLICTPSLHYTIPAGPKVPSRHDYIPVCEEGFVFSHGEDDDLVLARWKPWRERVLKTFLVELGRLLEIPP